MHLEILVEDASGKRLLQHVLPKIVGQPEPTTYNLHHYRGIGHLPERLHSAKDIRTKQLLTILPQLILGFGKTFSGYGSEYSAALLIICDLDEQCLVEFRARLTRLLMSIHPTPKTVFCFAIEEMEAWLLGDVEAVKRAYPRAKSAILNGYFQDSICCTWEVLANAVHKGGAKALKTKPYYEIGAQKIAWANEIAPHMNLTANRSPSFQYFCKKVSELAQEVE